MELKVNNVNKIQNAEIHLNGLTVIVGPNNSGKSTIGRTLFTTIKAVANSNYSTDLQRRKRLEKYAESLYQRVRGLSWETRDVISSVFPNGSFRFMNEIVNAEDVIELLNTKRSIIESLDIIPRQKNLILTDIDNIKILFEESDNKEKIIKTELSYLVESEFKNRFCAIGTQTSSVELNSEGTSKIVYDVEKNIVRNVKCTDTDFIDDATYVESPLYLHMLDTIIRAKTYREVNKKKSLMLFTMVPFHIKDLAEKMMNAARHPLLEYDRSLSIDQITGGTFAYDEESQQIVYKTTEGNTYSSINIASGLKTFGVLQLLLKGNYIGPNHMLIWDEPENHLHPEWQIKLAEIFVKLAKGGQPILITTHSPYFLQAIKFYSSKEKFEKYVNYYIPADRDNNLVELEEISRDLNRAFQLLAEPMNKIMEMDTEY